MVKSVSAPDLLESIVFILLFRKPGSVFDRCAELFDCSLENVFLDEDDVHF